MKIEELELGISDEEKIKTEANKLLSEEEERNFRLEEFQKLIRQGVAVMDFEKDSDNNIRSLTIKRLSDNSILFHTDNKTWEGREDIKKLLSIERSDPEIKDESVYRLEKHSYNNPDDIEKIMDQEGDIFETILNNMGAYSINLSDENGSQYAIVRDKKDNNIVYKTRNPAAIEMLFPEES